MAPIIRRIRIANPHKRRRKAKARTTRVRRRNSHRRTRVKARKRHRNPRGGELTMMTKNPHRKKRRTRSRSKRKNPFFSGGERKRRHSVRRHRRHRNPSVAGVQLSPAALAELGIAATAGAIGTRSLTQMVLQDKNTGWMGYGANLVAAVALGFLTKKFVGNKLAGAVVTGGIVGLGLRIWQEQIAKTVAPALSGLGDVDFSDNGMGAFVDTTFALPSSSVPGANGYLVVGPNNPGNLTPNAPAQPTAALPSRYASR